MSKAVHEGSGLGKEKAREDRDKLLKGAYGDLDEYERALVSRANLEKFKKGALAGMSPEEIEARRLETYEILRAKKEGAAVELEGRNKTEQETRKDSSGELLRRIGDDLANMRPQVARYWQTRSFLEKKELGEVLRIQSSKISEDIRKAQEEYMEKGDIMTASDLDNCATELGKMMRSIPPSEEDSYMAAA